MPFLGFDGQAGTGKTSQLIEAVDQRIAEFPLEPHQRVLALTFMHGSRRHLEKRLSALEQLRGRFTCMTIDSFAGHVAQRWETLCTSLGLNVGDFDQTCDCSGRLLEERIVARWVAATYPVVVVDEAQELSPPRLRIIKALTPYVALFVAADEFQCLDESIDTRPFVDWFRTGRVISLTHVHRTSQHGLLDAAAALRNGLAPPNNALGFKIVYEFPRQAPFAIGHTLHQARRAGGNIAMITAPGARAWASTVISRLIEGMRTPMQTVSPIRIGWETRPEDEVHSVMQLFENLGTISTADVVQRFAEIENPPPWLSDVSAAVRHQLRIGAQSSWCANALRMLVERKAALHRAYGFPRSDSIPVMSIHGAKNRQFRHVVVLWGHGVPGDATRQARLLYNAITRAESNCTVYVRGRDLLNTWPFRVIQ